MNTWISGTNFTCVLFKNNSELTRRQLYANQSRAIDGEDLQRAVLVKPAVTELEPRSCTAWTFHL